MPGPSSKLTKGNNAAEKKTAATRPSATAAKKHKSSSADDVTVSRTQTPSRSATPGRGAGAKKAAPAPERKKPAPTPPPKNHVAAANERASNAAEPKPGALKRLSSKKRPSASSAAALERSASANDILPSKGGRKSIGGGGGGAGAGVSFSAPGADPRISAELAEDVRRCFGDEAGPKVLVVLAEHGLWEADDVGLYVDKDGLLMSAALIGLRPLQLGKFKDWVRIKRDEERGVLTPAAGGHAPAMPLPAALPPRPPTRPEGAHLRAMLPAMPLPPPRYSGASASADSVLGGGGGGGLQGDDRSSGYSVGTLGTGPGGARTKGATLQQLVARRFKVVEGQGSVLAVLGHHAVEHEDDLGYAGPAVLATAKGSGALNLAQVNVLEDWVEAVQRRMRDGRRSFHDILLDPAAAKAEEDALAEQLGVAVKDALLNKDLDPEATRKAKTKAALAMYHLSIKKRHFKGLRPDTDVLLPPTWGDRRSVSGTTF